MYWSKESVIWWH